MSPQKPRTFSDAYAAAAAGVGSEGCPIEAGLILRLADNECVHGRLGGDRTPVCGCHPGEGVAA